MNMKISVAPGTTQKLRIYFAHPAFNEEQIALRDKILEVLNQVSYGGATPHSGGSLEVFNPFDYSPAIEGDRDAKKVWSKWILTSNKDLIHRTDIVLAVIDGRDAGVIWEMGYADALNKPIVTVSGADYDVNIMLGASVLLHITDITSSKGQQALSNFLNSYIKVVTA